jgi:uncharacterized protein YndB with AHSA1/START domain
MTVSAARVWVRAGPACPKKERMMRRRKFLLAASSAAALLTMSHFTKAEDAMAPLITHDVVVTRTFDAPPEEVWRAWTEDALVMQWWGPEGFTSPAERMDVRVGGTSVVALRSPDGHDMWMTWAYTQVEPHSRIEYVQNLSDETGKLIDPVSVGMPPEFPRDVATVVTLTPVGDKTEVTITEHTTTSEFMMEMSQLGLEQVLDKMEAIFAK